MIPFHIIIWLYVQCIDTGLAHPQYAKYIFGCFYDIESLIFGKVFVQLLYVVIIFGILFFKCLLDASCVQYSCECATKVEYGWCTVFLPPTYNKIGQMSNTAFNIVGSECSFSATTSAHPERWYGECIHLERQCKKLFGSVQWIIPSKSISWISSKRNKNDRIDSNI